MDIGLNGGATPPRLPPAAQHLAVMAAAEEYFAAGWVLVPLLPWSKKAFRREWNHRRNTVTTTAALQGPLSGEAYGGNIGCALQYSRICTVDLDNYEKAVVFFAKHGIDIPALMEAPDSVQSYGGKEGHRKLWFRLPDDVPFLPHVKRDDSDGFELRCATTGGTLTLQDMLPPSIHPDTGEPVRWEGTGDWRQLSVLPASLLSFWRELSQGARGNDAERGGNGCGGTAPAGAPGASERQSAPLVYVRSLLAFIDPGSGYEQWLEVGMAMHANDGSEASLKEWDEWSHRSDKYKPDECEAKWRSFDADRPGGVTLCTLVRAARNGGYSGSPADAKFAQGKSAPSWPRVQVPDEMPAAA